MSYKTNPVGLRIKHTIGWKFSGFSFKNNIISSILWLKIYLLLKAYLSMRNYKLLSCELRIDEKFDKIGYINIFKKKKKRKKIHKIKKNRLQKQRYNGIILGLYNRHFDFFKENYKNSTINWIKTWSYLKYPLNKLNIWTEVWWSRYISFFLKKKSKKNLKQFIQSKKLIKDLYKTKCNFRQVNIHRTKPLVWKNIYFSFFLNTKLEKLKLYQKTLHYRYLLTKKVLKIFADYIRNSKKYESFQNYNSSVMKYLMFNKQKIKTLKWQVRQVKKRAICFKKFIKNKHRIKFVKDWKYQHLKTLRRQKHHQKIIPYNASLLERASIFNNTSNIWFSKTFKPFKYKSYYFLRGMHQFIFLKKFLKKLYFTKNIQKRRKNTHLFNVILKYYKIKKKNIIIKKLAHLFKKRKKYKIIKKTPIIKKFNQSKGTYKYKKYTKKIFISFNNIPVFKKKPGYNMYEKKQKPKFTHALVTKKDIKYILEKKKNKKISRHTQRHTLVLSNNKKNYLKKFKMRQFTNLASFKLLSRFQLKYNIENWIKRYFKLNITLHVFQPLRNYKNLNWYRITKTLRIQNTEKTIWKKKFHLKSVELSKYPLLNIEHAFYSKNKLLKKKKHNIYLLMDSGRLFQTNIKEELFATSKWKIKALTHRFLPLFSLFSTYFEPQLLADQIAKELERTKNHNALYTNLEPVLDLLKSLNAFGLKLEIHGRFNGSVRTIKKYISLNNFTITTYNQRMNYAFAHSYARIGCFGVKLWIKF